MQVILLLCFHCTHRNFIVRRVHWLRARAQLMRWQEQVKLIGYEMQWTVRYYLYKSQNWALQPGPGHSNSISGFRLGPGLGPGPGLSSNIVPPSRPGPSNSSTTHNTSTNLNAGAIAYHHKQKAMWKDLVIKADRIFMRSNPAYQSPL